MIDRLLTTPALCETLGIHRTTLARWEKMKNFPKAIINGKPKRYKESDVIKWLENLEEVES